MHLAPGTLARNVTCTTLLKQASQSPLGTIIISTLLMKKLKAKTITEDHTARRVGSRLCHIFTQRLSKSEGWKGPEFTQSTPLRVQLGKLRPRVTQGVDSRVPSTLLAQATAHKERGRGMNLNPGSASQSNCLHLSEPGSLTYA